MSVETIDHFLIPLWINKNWTINVNSPFDFSYPTSYSFVWEVAMIKIQIPIELDEYISGTDLLRQKSVWQVRDEAKRESILTPYDKDVIEKNLMTCDG